MTDVSNSIEDDDGPGGTVEESRPAELEVELLGETCKIHCQGDWNFAGIADIDQAMRDIERAGHSHVTIDTSEVSAFDTAGAWLIERMRRRQAAEGRGFTHTDVDKSHELLAAVVQPDDDDGAKRRSFIPQLSMGPLEKIGRFVTSLGRDAVLIANMIGAAIRGPQLKAVKGRGIRVISIVNQLDHMAVRAFPVIGVMSFLIGAIIAQQGAFQLKWFGEELLTVNLVGILLLREIGVLLTAVMVAGRTGSAITAEIGTMKMREEIDALRVMGLNPVGVLVIPRIVALVIAMPILTLLADLAGLAGAMLVTWLYVGIPPEQFIAALRVAIDHSTLFAGLIKAPFMALIIGLISAVEGLKVSGSAESLGRHTTAAVVRSIFAVIVLDGLFAMFYASIGY